MIDYKKLQFWRDAHDLTIELFKFLEKNDLNKNYRLRDQLQGSILSVGSNLCEGSKGSSRELKRYFKIAVSSATECEYQILVLKDMDYISIDVYTRWQNQLDKIIGGIINYIRKCK